MPDTDQSPDESPLNPEEAPDEDFGEGEESPEERSEDSAEVTGWDLVPEDVKEDLAGEPPPTMEELGLTPPEPAHDAPPPAEGEAESPPPGPPPVEEDFPGFDERDEGTAPDDEGEEEEEEPEPIPTPLGDIEVHHPSMGLLLLVVAAVYGLIVLFQLVLYGGNATSFLQVGEKRFAPAVTERGEAALLPHPGSTNYTRDSFPAGTVVYNDEGYDGAIYFLVAKDPFVVHRGSDSTDLNVFRWTGKALSNYRRVAYSALIYALGLDNERLFPWAMLAINFLAVLVATWATAAVLKRHHIDIYLAGTLGLSAGMLFGFYYLTPVPMAVALVALMALAHDRGFELAGAFAAALAALSWEMTLVVTVPIALHSLFTRRYGRWFLMTASVLPLVGANFFFASRLGVSPWVGETGMIRLPLTGMFSGLVESFHVAEGITAVNLVRGAAVIPAMLFVAIVCVLGLWKFLQAGGPYSLALFFAAFVTISGYPDWWATFANAARVNTFLFLLVLLAYVEHRDRHTRHPLALGLVLTLMALARIVAYASKDHYFLENFVN